MKKMGNKSVETKTMYNLLFNKHLNKLCSLCAMHDLSLQCWLGKTQDHQSSIKSTVVVSIWPYRSNSSIEQFIFPTVAKDCGV